jgi:hypothetical protein
MPLRDLLDGRRRHRADAARNFDAILTAARAELTEHGTDGALDDIARRAEVGPATLTTSHPSRPKCVTVSRLTRDPLADTPRPPQGPAPAAGQCHQPTRTELSATGLPDPNLARNRSLIQSGPDTCIPARAVRALTRGGCHPPSAWLRYTIRSSICSLVITWIAR